MMTVAAAKVKSGSFSNCAARYSGERDSSKLEEFLSAVSTFKIIEKVSEDDAVSGMPMLLQGDDSEWWAGVKS